MKYTSAQAAKLLRQFEEEKARLLNHENMSSTFIAALQEDPETVRPVYDYKETQQQLEEVDGKIRKVKHAISLFNLTTEVPGFDMTVDQLLIYLPQLTARKRKLENMASRLPKARANAHYGSAPIIDYVYANYEIDEAAADLEVLADCLRQAQTALDLINSTELMEIDI